MNDGIKQRPPFPRHSPESPFAVAFATVKLQYYEKPKCAPMSCHSAPCQRRIHMC